MPHPAALGRLLSVEEYLRMERDATVKHEYVAGEVHAMVGTSKRHNRVAANVFSLLDAAAGDGPCRVYFADVKVRAAEDVFYYPDVMVACGPEQGDAYVEEAPCLIVEVVSPSTETVDRREKLLLYRRLPSLRAYLIVDPAQRRVDRFWRDEQGEWHHDLLTGSGTVPVPCPETELPMDRVYARLL